MAHSHRPRRKLPAWQFYIGDVLKETGFQLLSGPAQNLWIRLLMHMHENTPRGKLTLNGRVLSDEEIADLCKMEIAEFKKLLWQIEEKGLSTRDSGALANRRMLRESEEYEKKRKAGAVGAEHRWHRDSTPPCESIAKGNRIHIQSNPIHTKDNTKDGRNSVKPTAPARSTVATGPEWDGFVTRIWTPWPPRDGKKLGKQEAWAKYQQLAPPDRDALALAVQHFLAHPTTKKGIGIKDLHRWIRSGTGIEPWREWIEPTNHAGGAHGKPLDIDAAWDQFETEQAKQKQGLSTDQSPRSTDPATRD